MTAPYREAGLSDKEYEKILSIMGREPNDLEIALIGVMWSEHCSYKSTRALLAQFPNKSPKVAQGPGENAGVVDCGGGWGLAFKVESHNHPSAVAPYQGAATGVGGIIRDILAMGARPCVSMDGLFFAPPTDRHAVHLATGIVEGIAGYGNAVGVPTIGGKTYYDGCYEGNPLVNAFCAGLVKLDSIVSSKTARPGDLAVLLGSKTGRDGIAGASFASKELADDSRESRPQIQIGDPFEEKLLIECCLDLQSSGLLRGMQDMGAAGILSSSSEIAHKSGVGIDIDCDKIPLREKMEPWEIFLSESQERMLLIVEPKDLSGVRALADHYALECEIVGTIVEGDRYRVFVNGEVAADLPVSILGDTPLAEWKSEAPADAEARKSKPEKSASVDFKRDLIEMLRTVHGRERREIWDQYDCQVQINTAEEPGAPVSAIKLPDPDSLVLFSMEAEPRKCYADPYLGAAETMALSARVLTLAGAEPLGMTNCLNFASPERPENYWALSECVRGLVNVCRNSDIPVVSGNVSLYNETAKGAIYPSPLVVTVGLVSHLSYYVPSGRAAEDDLIYFVGPRLGEIGGSRWQAIADPDRAPQGSPCRYDPGLEREFSDRALRTSRRVGVHSARIVSGGGLAVALAREAISTGLGMKVELPASSSPDELTAMLFGEGGPRAIYFVAKETEEKFLSVWEGYEALRIGTVGGESLSIAGSIDASVSELTSAFVDGDLLLELAKG